MRVDSPDPHSLLHVDHLENFGSQDSGCSTEMKIKCVNEINLNFSEQLKCLLFHYFIYDILDILKFIGILVKLSFCESDTRG